MITFSDTLDGTTAGQESLSVIGSAIFGGRVGNSSILEKLTVTGTTAINGGVVNTTGDQTYLSAVTFSLPNGDSFSAVLDLSTLDGTNGFRLDGIDASDESGFSVSGARRHQWRWL